MVLSFNINYMIAYKPDHSTAYILSTDNFSVKSIIKFPNKLKKIRILRPITGEESVENKPDVYEFVD